MLRPDSSENRTECASPHSCPLYVLVTLDAEDHFTDRTAEDAGRGPYCHDFGGEAWGLDRIAEICEYYDAPLTVFLSVFEHVRWGANTLEQICNELQHGRHDIQLHTHPHWCFDERRKLLSDYDASEQRAILKEGAKLIEAWTGQFPVAHRSGAYGVSPTSLQALRHAGIPMDMSSYRGHPNCDLTTLVNQPHILEGVMEVPVTSVSRRKRCGVGILDWTLSTSFVKTDIEFIDDGELKAWVDQRPLDQSCVLVLFMHSYSLVKRNGRVVLGPSSENETSLRNQLQWLQTCEDVEFTTASSLHTLWADNAKLFDGKDFQPVSPVEFKEPLISSLVRRGRKRLAFLRSSANDKQTEVHASAGYIS